MLTLYGDESAYATTTPEELQETMAAYTALDEELKASGALLGGEALEPTSSATTVRVREGRRLLTDGPFAETKEQLGGFYLLECASLDEALDWAAKVPDVHSGSVEVRPVMDVSQFGGEQDGAAAGAGSS